MRCLSDRIRTSGTRANALLAGAILSVAFAASVSVAEKLGANEPAVYVPVQCEGSYSGHLQGLDVDGKGHIFWSFTEAIVKTDRDGKIIQRVDAPSHQGDLVYENGRVYVAVNLGLFNDPQKRADSWVYVYDADDLALLSKHEIDDVVYGAGGMAYHDGRFLVVGGLPDGHEVNHLFEYDADFRLLAHHEMKSGHTHLGIQSAAYAEGRWWFGCYGSPPQLLIADDDFTMAGRHTLACSLGVASIGEGRLFLGRGKCEGGSCTGWTVVARPDEDAGFIELPGSSR
jgi:hypothetical protein